jgi:uncharacterized protein
MSDPTQEKSQYQIRVVDKELDELMTQLPAISLEGPKGVGKTATATVRAETIRRLDDPAELEIIQAQPSRLVEGSRPVVIDEWQRYPASWDLVRRAVDADPSPGRFLLTGSATPTEKPTHSGAGRIVPIRMRPLTLAERGLEAPSVSLGELLSGRRSSLAGTTKLTLEDYTDEIVTGGFPGMRFSNQRAQRAALDGYLARIVDTDIPELGVTVRNPATLWRWVRAFAAATSTSTSYEKIRNAAAGGEDEKSARSTLIGYRDALERIWILDDLAAWSPTRNHLQRITAAPKHHLVDPALAVRLLGLDAGALLAGQGPNVIPRDGTFLGALFESLSTQGLRVFAQAGEATVAHLRTMASEREVDLIVVRGDGKIVAFEVKLSATVGDHDVRHLHWLRETLGDDLLDAVVLTTGVEAYRRDDGIGVVPLALLGP